MKKISLSLFALTAFSFVALAQPGSLDPTFNSGSGADYSVYTTVLQDDGKILIAGSFDAYNGTPRNKIARLNKDGSLDTGFKPSIMHKLGYVSQIALQADGKILIVGMFLKFKGPSRGNVTRLNSNGRRDRRFKPGDGTIVSASALALQADGKIIIVGEFTEYNGISRNRVARINANGSLDNGFDPGTGADQRVITTALQADGKILIGGDLTSYNGTTINRVASLNADGSLDTGFDSGTGADNRVYTIVVQADGKILIGGEFTAYNGITRNRIVRINADGSLDSGFDPGTGADNTVSSIALQADGKIIIGGNFTSYNGTTRNRIARLNADGSLDTGFDPLAGANEYVFTTALQTDGKIIIGGSFTSYNGTPINHIARIIGDSISGED